MSTILLSRREFLKSTGFSVSGLVLGYNWMSGKDSVGATFNPNAFIVINKENGVTLYISVPELGQNIRTTFAMILSDELGADLETVSIKQAPPRNDMGLQTAGGSNSVKKSYQNLRESAAVAREMLIAGAAEFWKVPAGKCRTEKSMVLGPGSRSLSFVETVPYAEKQPVPENPPLKPDSELKYIGKATKVMDAREIGMGKTIFGMDAMPENVHFAVMIRCPVYQGKLKSFDSTAAKAMPGVVDVLKVGDKIAVVAKNTWFAINASWVVSVEWDEGANAGADTRELVEKQKEAVRNPKQSGFSRGDFESAFESADIRMDKEFSAPILTHAPMEPPTCTAWYKKGEVEIWGSCQSLNKLYEQLPKYTGLPREKITYHQLRIGGGFGRKLAHDYIEEALGIAKLVDYPVKLIFTREDDTRHDKYRASDRYRYRVGMEKNGFPVALEESSARRTKIKEPSDIAHFFPNIIRKCTFVTPPVATGPMRAPGQNVSSFTEQSMIDCMAEKVGIDPLDYRLALHGDAETMNKLGWDKAPVESPIMCELLKSVKRRSKWKSDSRFGYGVVDFRKYDSYVALVALAPKSGNGRPVDQVYAAVNIGRVINPLGATAQVEGAIIDGIAAALYQKIDLRNGSVVQSNCHDYKMLEMPEAPDIDVEFMDSVEAPQGLGEMAYPPMMPATVNALYAATGKRTTDLPVKG